MPALRYCLWAFSGRGERGCPPVAVHGLPCRGFSCCEHRLWPVGFRSCGSGALECGLSSCGTWAQLPHSTWNLPRPGIKPVSPALHTSTLNHWTTRDALSPYILDVSHKHWGLPGGSAIKNLPPTMRETWVWTLGWKIPWSRAWQPTPVFLPRESNGQRSLAG